MFTNESEASAESEAYDSPSVVPVHTRLELSSDSDSANDSASVASVASVNQPLKGYDGSYEFWQKNILLPLKRNRTRT